MADEYTPVEINALVEKTTPADADNVVLEDSADSNKWKKFSFASLRTWVTTFFTAFKTADNIFAGANVFPNLRFAGCTAENNGANAEGELTEAGADYSHSEGGKTIASEKWSHSEGYETLASALIAHSEGYKSNARLLAQHAHAGGYFTVAGDAQYTRNVLNKETEDATPVECIQGTTQRYVIPASYTMACTVTINASNATGSVAGFYKRQALIKNIAGTTALIGTVQTIGTDIETGSIGGIAITADDTNDSLLVTVTGKAAETIRWVCVIDALEVGH